LLNADGDGYIVLAGKEEGFYYKEGEIVSVITIEEVDSLVEDLKEKGYTQFVITKIVRYSYDIKKHP